MLELQRRLAYGIPGAPRTRQSTSLAFFEELERRLAGQDVPCWCGEFYFEYHRGVFTTMARNKRYNRLAEFKNADADGAFSVVYRRNNGDYGLIEDDT